MARSEQIVAVLHFLVGTSLASIAAARRQSAQDGKSAGFTSTRSA
jgi:hypothetical protein